MVHSDNNNSLTHDNPPVVSYARTSILVCVNDNEHSRVALKFACAKSKKTGCLVSILHVLEPADYQGLSMVMDHIENDKRKVAEKLLHDMADLANQFSGVTPVLMLREGINGKEIVAVANQDHTIGMLVMGSSPETPGKGKLLSWLVGQLGKELLIPMIIVPGNLTEQQIEALA